MPDIFKIAVKYAVYLMLFYFAAKYALPLIAPFVIGLGLAATVQKPAEILSGRIPALNRKVCCVIMTSAVIFGFSAVIYLVLCSAVNGAISFCPEIPDRLGRLRQIVADASEGSSNKDAWSKFTSFVASGANWCMDFFSENYRDYLPAMLRRSTNLIAGLPSLMTAAAFSALSAFFACVDFMGIKSGIKRLLPEKIASKAVLIVRTSADTLSALTKTYGLIMLITFSELLVGLGIMKLTGHGTGNIITIALVIAIIDIFPVLGTGTVLVPWGIFEMLSGRVVSGIMLLVLFVLIETMRSMLEPKLISDRLRMPPFFTLAGVYVGGKLFGAAGIFIMPFAMMVFRRLIGQEHQI